MYPIKTKISTTIKTITSSVPIAIFNQLLLNENGPTRQIRTGNAEFFKLPLYRLELEWDDYGGSMSSIKDMIFHTSSALPALTRSTGLLSFNSGSRECIQRIAVSSLKPENSTK